MEDKTVDKFTRAYIQAMMWTEYADEELEIPIDEEHDLDDLAPEALAAIVAVCKEFQESNAAALAEAYASPTYDEERAGLDFWLTRNGHGVGFWDRGLGSIGDVLTRAAKVYGECHGYVGDDGKVYVA
jgi:hypothetical protein